MRERLVRSGYRQRLAARFLIVALTGLLPLSGLLIWNVYGGYQQTRAEKIHDLKSIGRATASRIDFDLAMSQAVLQEIAASGGVRSSNARACSRFLETIHRPWAFAYTLFSRSTPKGIVDCSSLGPKKVNVGLTPNIRAALAGHLGIGPARIGPQSGVPVLPVSWPLRNASGRIIAILNTGIRLSWLKQTFPVVSQGQKGEHLWLLQNGQSILSLPNKAHPPVCAGGYPPSGKVKICRMKSASGHSQLILAFGSDFASHLQVLVASPLSSIEAPAYQNAWIAGLVTLIVILLTSVAMLGLGHRHLFLPLKSIEELVRRFGSGDYRARLPENWKASHKNNEIVTLGIQIEHLGGLLEKSLAQLALERDHLARIAMSDPLTGLPNRRALDEELERALARAKRGDTKLAVCALDLDGFKAVNDHYGHEAGDLVLQAIGERLQNNLRKNDFVARVGGDEFVVLLEFFAQRTSFTELFDKIGHVVRSPVLLPGENSVQVGVSMGVCLFPNDGCAPSNGLLRAADQALYQSKAHKADRQRFWVVVGESPQLERNRFQVLLDQGALEVAYQPILNVRSGRIEGVEALARLRDGDRLLAPRQFLDELDAKDRSRLTLQILDRLLMDLRALDSEGYSLWGAFNVETDDLQTPLLRHELSKRLEAIGFEPARLHLEILEGGDFLNRKEAMDELQALHLLGVKLALDDIGSAYSSLLRLKELPVDVIKLDQAFVRGLEKRPADLSFVLAMQELANDLRIEMVVEGVETRPIADAVEVLGTHFVQGYALAKPLPFKQLAVFIATFEFSAKAYPDSLLGLYAYHLMFDRKLASLIFTNPQMVAKARVADARQCKFHAAMKRLGIGEESHLARLHAEYHLLLSEANDKTAWVRLRDVNRQILEVIATLWEKTRQAAEASKPAAYDTT